MRVIIPGLAVHPSRYEALGGVVVDLPLDAGWRALREQALRLAATEDSGRTAPTEATEDSGRTARTETARTEATPTEATRIELVAHSMGAVPAIQWAREYPEEISRLLLADPMTPRDTWTWPDFARGLARGTARVLGGPVALGLRAAKLWPGASRRTGAAVVRQYLCAQRWENEATWSQQPVAVPTVVLVGAGDGKEQAFLESQQAQARRLGAECRFLEGLKHSFPLTHPEVITAALGEKDPTD